MDLTLEELESILENQDLEALDARLWALPIGDRALIVDRLNKEKWEALLTLLEPQHAAELLEELSDQQAQAMLSTLSPEKAAPIVDQIHSDTRADIVGGLGADDTNAILNLMIPEEAEDLRELISHAPGTAGAFMITEYLEYDSNQTIGQILEDLQINGEKYADYDVQYAYICDKTDKLVGVLRMRDVLFTQRNKKASDVMIPSPVNVKTTSPLDSLIRFFDDYRFYGVPVIDDEGVLCGVLRRAAVEEASAERANSIFLKVSGIIGGEELRSMNLTTRFSRRLGFLSLNIVLNILAASVIAMNMETLDQVIALAVFMPIISDMSGCSGNQAVAVSIRELTMGLIRPKDFIRVFKKEAAVGIINGIALGFLIGLVAYFWKGSAWLSLVVGASLMLNTLVAVCFGGLIPLILKGLKLDPALVSGPMLTTVTDMCGFFLVLSLAAMIIEKLV